MQIQARSRSASNTLATYFRQRIHPLVILGLGVLVFLYSRPVSKLSVASTFCFVFVIAFLLVFRLYDDILQVPNDIGKPDRSYTDSSSRKTLSIYLIVFLILLLIFACYLSWYLASVLFLFIAFNHVLYLLLVNNKTAAGFLPLVKYPFVYVVLQFSGLSGLSLNASFLFPAIALFVAFVAFESMDDRTFPVRAKYSSVLQISSFAIILLGNFSATATLAGTVLLSLSLISGFLWTRASPYLYFLCFLLFKLSVDNL